jgi:uncharacterized Fe-S cluster protein YjdI
MKEYADDDLVVSWRPERCLHSRNCVRGLPGVFDRSKRPWINMAGASSEEIMKTIDQCPSGALSYKRASENRACENEAIGNESGEMEKMQDEPVSIRVTKNGPLLVEGNYVLVDQEGKRIVSSGPFALCRCGSSRNKPFCDGSHVRTGFDDTI